MESPSSDTANRIGCLGENEVIRRLAELTPQSTSIRTGIGDDCAVVRMPGAAYDWLLTSDPVIEGVHFQADTDPVKVGRKAVGRVLSDIAAMGGEILWVLIDIVAPPATDMERLEGVYQGAVDMLQTYNAAIVGGDTAKGALLELHVFAVGRSPVDLAVKRDGAKLGDAIYVTGELGYSLQGKHLDFQPRMAEGLWLSQRRLANSMCDISDGLAMDLGHILKKSQAGAVLKLANLPIAQPDRQDDRSGLDHALYDGEDFELVFTVAPEKKDQLETEWRKHFTTRLTAIGEITAELGIMLGENANGERTELKAAGYQHFG